MKKPRKLQDILAKSMNQLADFIGKPKVFAAVLLLVAGWFIARFFIEYETWLDSIDIAIFVSTFLLLFIIQSSQNADTKAIQDKLDELIDAMPGADTNKEKEEKHFKKEDA